jgi:hypothetical protein
MITPASTYPLRMVWLYPFSVALLAAALPYALLERRWRWRWREIEVGRERVHADESGAYRQGGATVPVYRREAPRLVRVAAFSSLLFGQLFVPGLALGAFGLIAGGLGILLAPGLVANAKLYLAGLALLRRDPRTAWFRARNAAAWTFWVNVTLIAVAVAVAPFTRYWLWPALVVFIAYLVASMLPALLLRLAASANEDALFLPSER